MKDTPFADMAGADAAAAEPAVMEPVATEPVVIVREEHSISRRDIDQDALRVLYRLSRHNYIAYLVGGGVRDLLLGRKPKDFDISTNARPEQIRSLFRNCILIGRRFRLAHVRYGEKIIETSTFRSTPKLPANPDDPEADLFQRDDNLFGTPAEDAFRRDFTVNGLFYNIEDFTIIDYVGGMEDLAARRIRCIGDPNIRFREDPVRMVRAVRFASRLGFSLDAGTEDAIRRHGEELTKASPARLLEEITRLFAFSSGERAVRLLHATGLLRVILPEVSSFLDGGDGAEGADVFWRRLRALDTGDTVLPEGSPSLIFAVLFLDALKASLRREWTFDTTPKLRFDRVHAFLDPLSVRLRFPRKLVDRIVHMYINQNRFAPQSERGKKGSLTNFVTQESFHESLALAEIVLTSENGDQTCLNRWRDLLAERIFGRDDDGAERERERHGGERDHDRRSRHGGRDRHGHEDGADAFAPLTLVEAQGFSHRAASKAEHAAAERDGSDNGNGNGGREENHDAGHDENRDDASAASSSGHKLSRSARRRRNKRLRRQQEQQPAAELRNAPAEQPRPATRGVVFAVEPPEPSAPEHLREAPRPEPKQEQKPKSKSKPEAQQETRPEPKSNSKPESRSERKSEQRSEQKQEQKPEQRPESKPAQPQKSAPQASEPKPSSSRARGRRKSHSDQPAPQSSAAQSAPLPPAEPPKPLTAAAFWSEPEPEPKPEKKPRATRKKAASKSKPKSASPSADSPLPEERPPLPMDRADEADIPISWLDEI